MDESGNPTRDIGRELRDLLLDAHEFESDIFRGVASADMANAKPGHAERLKTIALWRAEQNAEFFMQLAHLADQLSEAATDDDGETWKHGPPV